MFLLIKIKMSLRIAMQQRARRNHLGVQARTRCQQTMKIAAMSISDVDHGGNAQAPVIAGIRSHKRLSCGRIMHIQRKTPVSRPCDKVSTTAQYT
jgi:hypothetical protein